MRRSPLGTRNQAVHCDQFTGTLAAGFLVGVIMSVSSLIALTLPSQFQFHADLASLLTFLIFIVILMVRPRGLFGHGIAE